MTQKKYTNARPDSKQPKDNKKKGKRPQLHEIIQNQKNIKHAKKEQKEKQEKEQIRRENFTKIDEEQVEATFENMFDQMRDIAKKRKTETTKDDDIYMEETDQPLVDTEKQRKIMALVLKNEQERRQYALENPIDEKDVKKNKKKTKYGVYCEYVGVGEYGMREAVAQICIASDDGKIVYQQYIKTSEPITDYRDKKPNDFLHGVTLNKAKQDIEALEVHLGVIIGLHIARDISILFTKGATPSLDQIRDVSLYDPIEKRQTKSTPKPKRDGDDAELQHLGTRYIGLEKNALKTISSKAKAVLRIYKSFEKEYDSFFHSPDGKRIVAESKVIPAPVATHKKKQPVDRRAELEAKVNVRKTLDDQIDLLMRQIKKGDSF